MTMRYALDMINAGDYADPRTALRLAESAEANGWGGFFMWDHLSFVWNGPSGDPWVTLAAVAARTERLVVGTAVTPVARRRPQVLAHHLVALDHLSGGRVVFGVGLGGVPDEFSLFGDPADAKQRAAMLDEGLAVITQLWLGEKVEHHGAHYTVDGVVFQPRPVQQPRIPIWVGGESQPALRRAARWDGWIIGMHDGEGKLVKTPDQLAKDVAALKAQRTLSTPFDVAIIGNSTPSDGALLREFAAAGATWWLEHIHGMRGSFDQMLARVAAGPPA
jgi:alkanesulfonate monooxygenase SsuD/methylene tetrahydromethanopterin reductase-like flavin-dependent oxidoreductase (luciferase family)